MSASTVVHDGRVFTEITADTFPGEPYAMRVEVNKDTSDPEDQDRLAGLVGYAWRSTVAGESLGYVMDTPTSLIFDADSTKSARDDLGMAFEDFLAVLPRMIADGTPVRKTNRAGAGTKGTRLIEGLGSDVVARVFFDSVVSTSDWA